MHHIDIRSFYRYFSEISDNFSNDPEPIFSYWNEISESFSLVDLDYSIVNIIGLSSKSEPILKAISDEDKEERKNELCNSFNDYTKNSGIDLRIAPSDSSRVIAGKIISLANLLIKDDKFIDNDIFLMLLSEESRKEYLSSIDDIYHKEDSIYEDAISRATNFLGMVQTFYEDLSSLDSSVIFATKHKNSLIKFFTGRNIRLVTGDFDRETIRKLIKKHFGYNSNSSKDYGPLISQLLNDQSPSQKTNTTLKGHELELKISETYKMLGYEVKITKFSGDFGIDIIAESNSEKIGIQCKNFESNVGVDAIMQAYSGGKFYDCTRYCVITNIGYTEPARELANKLGVEILTYRNN